MEWFKCVNCKSLSLSPVYLPCLHIVCHHHTRKTNSQEIIKCEECEMHFKLPEISQGEKIAQAKQDQETFRSYINIVENFLADPSFFLRRAWTSKQ